MKTIDITPKFREIIPVLLHIYANGEPKAQQEARQALCELAIVLDKLKEQHPEILVEIEQELKYIK